MLAGDIIGRALCRFARSDADDTKRGMLCRVGHLALQRLEAASHNIGFAEAKLAGELLEPTALPPVEINLHGLAYALLLAVMRLCHELMILGHEISVKLPQDVFVGLTGLPVPMDGMANR
jgi:hypothetical protein